MENSNALIFQGRGCTVHHLLVILVKYILSEIEMIVRIVEWGLPHRFFLILSLHPQLQTKK